MHALLHHLEDRFEPTPVLAISRKLTHPSDPEADGGMLFIAIVFAALLSSLPREPTPVAQAEHSSVGGTIADRPLTADERTIRADLSKQCC